MTIGTKYRPGCLLKDFDTSNTMDSSQDWHQHHDISQQNGANSREWASTLIFAYLTFWATRTISIMSWYWTLKILIFSTIYSHTLIIFEILNLTRTWLFDTRSDSYSTNLVLVHSLENSCYTAYYVCRWRCNGLYFGLFCFSLCMHGVSSTLIYYRLWTRKPLYYFFFVFHFVQLNFCPYEFIS